MIIGITGIIGSGKSTAAAFFKSLGWAIVDADTIGWLVVDQNKGLLKKLVTRFGGDIITPTGRLSRPVLRRRALLNDQTRIDLNLLVHPYLVKELLKQVKALKKQGRDILVDAALILQWNLDSEFDATIMIHAKEADRIKRMKKRGFNKIDVRRIQKLQMTFSQIRRRCDYLVYNNGTQIELHTKLSQIIKKLPH